MKYPTPYAFRTERDVGASDPSTPGVTMRRAVVTPEMASRWLEGHQNYRKLRPAHVKRIAADMIAGNFREVGDPIRFDSSGALVDGQHRLSAIVESGVSLPMWICRGVDHVEVVDTGKPRSTADVLRVATGMTNHNNIVASLRRLHINRLADISGSGQAPNFPLTNSQILEYVQRHPEIERASVDASTVCHRSILAFTEAIAVLHFAQINDLDYDEVMLFLGAVRDGDGLRKGDPAYTLRERLIGTPNRGGRDTASARMWFILRSLEAHLSGEPLKLLRFKPNETAWPQF